MANIEEYARSYGPLTEAKADELLQNPMAYQKMRSELLAKYCDRIKQSLWWQHGRQVPSGGKPVAPDH